MTRSVHCAINLAEPCARRSGPAGRKLQSDRRQRFMLCREHQSVAQQAALLAQGTLGCHPGDLRMIVLLRKVRQNEELGTSIIVADKEFCEFTVGEMADPAHHALLDTPRIGTAAQHLEIMV